MPSSPKSKPPSEQLQAELAALEAMIGKRKAPAQTDASDPGIPGEPRDNAPTDDEPPEAD